MDRRTDTTDCFTFPLTRLIKIAATRCHDIGLYQLSYNDDLATCNYTLVIDKISDIGFDFLLFCAITLRPVPICPGNSNTPHRRGL